MRFSVNVIKAYVCLLIITVMVSLFVFTLFKDGPRPRPRIEQYDEYEPSYIFGDPLDQGDPIILEYIRQHHLTPPSTEKYNLNKSISAETYPLHEVLEEKLRELFKGKENGVFVECGALDGERFSHTLRLETKFNWTGILIEASPLRFNELKQKNRKAWLADVCLSGADPERMMFLEHSYRKGNGKLLPVKKYEAPLYFQRKEYKKIGIVECFPLFSILSAANMTSIDFFSLNIEGHEYKVLDAIQFDLLDIKVLAVEHWLAPEGKKDIQDLMEGKGYTMWFESESDYIFVQNQVS